MSKSRNFKHDERVVASSPAGSFKAPNVNRKLGRGDKNLNGNKVQKQPRIRPEGTGAGTSCKAMESGRAH